jgi:type IV pilus assembly protein PilX
VAQSRRARSQQGAALIIALVLLLVLTVLAVSGMNSASTELVMAGNEQYRQEAFRYAETAAEKAINNGVFDGTTIDTSVSGTIGSNGTYAATITPQLNGAILSSAAGNTYEVAGSIHYEIRNVGTTVRNSSVTTWQGVAQITPRSPGDFRSDTTLGSTF